MMKLGRFLLVSVMFFAGCSDEPAIEVGAPVEEKPFQYPMHLDVYGPGGGTAAGFLDSLNRMAASAGALLMTVHDDQGKFDLLVLPNSETVEPLGLQIDGPKLEVLFGGVAFGGVEMSDDELLAALEEYVATVDRLHAGLYLPISASDSNTVSDCRKYLRIAADAGVKKVEVWGIFIDGKGSGR